MVAGAASQLHLTANRPDGHLANPVQAGGTPPGLDDSRIYTTSVDSTARKRLFKAYEAFQKEIEGTMGDVKDMFRGGEASVADRADLMLTEIERAMECHKNQVWQAWVGLSHGLKALRQYMGLIVDRDREPARHV